MELLHDKWLVDIYLDAIEYKLDEKFIDLLLMEVLRRKIPIVHIGSLDYALPYLVEDLNAYEE